MNELLRGLKALGLGRLVAMAAVGVSVLALMTLLIFRTNNEKMALLYSELDIREAGQIGDLLEHQHIAHQLGNEGTEILVPINMISAARLLIARNGLPSGGAIGYEIFDRSDGLVASQFQQSINQTRALEGELARTIRGIRGVRNARVHLVLPRRDAFASSHIDSQGSVLLTMVGSNRIDHESVQAIITLVAAAVPGLRPQNVAIIDSQGNLLARAGTEASPDSASGAISDLRRTTELRLTRAVEEMLESSLGVGHVRAEAAVDLDVDQVRETDEKYDPDGQVARGTQSVNSSRRNTDPGSPTTVQNNLPNSDTEAHGSSNQEQKQEETTNYEIGKVVRTIARDRPQIRRISIAVMVDGIEAKDEKGALQWRPRSKEEIERIVTLVQSAIGYDTKRGDRVDVVTMRFKFDENPATTVPNLLGRFETVDLIRLGETGLLGLLGVAVLLFVLRPMVMRITALPGDVDIRAIDVALPDGQVGTPHGNDSGQLLLARSHASLMLAGETSMAKAPGMPRSGDDAVMSVGSAGGQIRESSIRRIAELVETHPEESLAIVRAWMHQEAA